MESEILVEDCANMRRLQRAVVGAAAAARSIHAAAFFENEISSSSAGATRRPYGAMPAVSQCGHVEPATPPMQLNSQEKQSDKA